MKQKRLRDQAVIVKFRQQGKEEGHKSEVMEALRACAGSKDTENFINYLPSDYHTETGWVPTWFKIMRNQFFFCLFLIRQFMLCTDSQLGKEQLLLSKYRVPWWTWQGMIMKSSNPNELRWSGIAKRKSLWDLIRIQMEKQRLVQVSLIIVLTSTNPINQLLTK